MSALGDSVVGMMAHYDWAHAVLLFDPDGFSLVSAGVYREKLQAAGVDIVLDQVALDPDHQLMSDIKASGCKIIVTLHYCTQVRKMLLMAKEMDMLSGQASNPKLSLGRASAARLVTVARAASAASAARAQLRLDHGLALAGVLERGRRGRRRRPLRVQRHDRHAAHSSARRAPRP